MTMTIRRVVYPAVIFLLFLMGPGNLLGQNSDFQSWWEFEFDYSLGTSLQLEGELEQRFKNNSLQYSRTLLTVGLEYDAARWLSLGGAARAVLVADQEGRVQPRYRIHFQGTGSHDLSDFRFSFRTRMQYGFEDFLFITDLRDNSLVFRNRLKGQYHIFGTKFGLFATVESWHNLSKLPDPAFHHMRYSAGVRYGLNFTSAFSLRYIFEDEFNVNNPDRLHILVLSYDHSF
jgi:hypothetical protein